MAKWLPLLTSDHDVAIASSARGTATKFRCTACIINRCFACVYNFSLVKVYIVEALPYFNVSTIYVIVFIFYCY